MGYKAKPLADRFWAYVSNDGDGRCWPWLAGRNRNGYGVIMVRKHDQQIASRIAYFLTHGPIPNGMWVLHHCDNPPCCNPDHLFLGTNQDNIADKISRGRSTHGMKHPMVKLTDAEVMEIRRLRGIGLKTKDVAKSFGVSLSLVVQIANRSIWRHLS